MFCVVLQCSELWCVLLCWSFVTMTYFIVQIVLYFFLPRSGWIKCCSHASRSSAAPILKQQGFCNLLHLIFWGTSANLFFQKASICGWKLLWCAKQRCQNQKTSPAYWMPTAKNVRGWVCHFQYFYIFLYFFTIFDIQVLGLAISHSF